MLEITRIETLHYADKVKTEDCILELLLWLNHLTKQIKVVAKSGGVASPLKSSKQVTSPEKGQQPTLEPANHSSPMQSLENEGMLRDIINRKRTLGLSKSQKFESTKIKLIKHDRLSKSSGHSPISKSNDFLPVKMHSSGIAVSGFCCDKEKAMDAIDGLGTTVSYK